MIPCKLMFQSTLCNTFNNNNNNIIIIIFVANDKTLATCGVFLAAVLAIIACNFFHVDVQVCLGTITLIAGRP